MKNQVNIKPLQPVIGQFWQHNEVKDIYIVAYVGNGFVLVSINNGYYWHTIESEIDNIFNGQQHLFSHVANPFEVIPNK